MVDEITNQPMATKRKRTVQKRAGATTLKEPSDWFKNWVLNLTTDGGSVASVTVNQRTALGLSAYFACIRIISEDVAGLPLDIISRKGNKITHLDNHPCEAIFNRTFSPEEDMSAFSGRETIIAHALAYHGGFAEIQRDGAGRPVALLPIDPTTVDIVRTASRQIAYRVRNAGIPDIFLRHEDVFHIHGLGFDGITGYVISNVGKMSLALAMAAQEFGASFFANGLTADGALECPGPLKDNQRKSLVESFKARHQGVKNAWNPLLLEEGMTYNKISQTPQESQMIESLSRGDLDVCRNFRVHPAKVGVQSSTDPEWVERYHVSDTLGPWMLRFEQEIARKLLEPGLYAKHNPNARLRGNTAAQSTFFREMWGTGVFSGNDILALLDMGAVEGGDRRFVPSTMMPLDLSVQFWEKKVNGELDNGGNPIKPIEPVKPATPPDNDPKGGDDPDNPGNQDNQVRSIVAAHADLLAAELTRIFERTQRERSKNKGIEKVDANHLEVVKNAAERQLGALIKVLSALNGRELQLCPEVSICADTIATRFMRVSNTSEIPAFCALELAHYAEVANV